MKSPSMSKAAMFAILAACASIHAVVAQAKHPSDTQITELKRAARPLVHCAAGDAGTDAGHPCSSGRGGNGPRVASEPSRQELECLLWGTCPEDSRPAVNS